MTKTVRAHDEIISEGELSSENETPISISWCVVIHNRGEKGEVTRLGKINLNKKKMK